MPMTAHMGVCVWVRERERERWKQGEGERETARERQRERDKRPLLKMLDLDGTLTPRSKLLTAKMHEADR